MHFPFNMDMLSDNRYTRLAMLYLSSISDDKQTSIAKVCSCVGWL